MAAMDAGEKINEKYKEMSLSDHILLRPESYIGSTKEHTQKLWVYENEEMVYRSVTYIPGLCKIFEEILLNAADNKLRDPSMDSVIVKIDESKNLISVRNSGDGVPVVEYPGKENVYVPQIVFGTLLTSSNFHDNVKRNGCGAKLTNLFSTRFTIKTADGKNTFEQVFTSNMNKKTPPTVTRCESADKWTDVTFEPDLKKFNNISEIGKDMVALMSKRVVEIAACLGNSVQVILNDKLLEVNSFEKYVDLYLGANKSRKDPLPRMTLKVKDKWEVFVSIRKRKFQQVSFVNSIATIKGGTHVDYVTRQITNYIINAVKKKKKNARVETDNVKNHIWVFVNALIDNPDFDSLKETLTLPQRSFGSKCEFSEDIMENDENSDVVKQLLLWATPNHNKDAEGEVEEIDGIDAVKDDKLNEAVKAGTEDAKDCTLILTEGDSAKAFAISGLNALDSASRAYYGVFALQGKLLNVRSATKKAISKNQQIQQLKSILGLEDGMASDNLRYGKVMIMTDQDHDGFHIKGLIINLFHYLWPDLLKRDPPFLSEFVTPVVKATHEDKGVRSFYSIPEYKAWKDDTDGYIIKYYKGLGTNTGEEAEDYFRNFNFHKKDLIWKSDDEDGEAIILAFSKENVEARKKWVKNYQNGTYLDRTVLEQIRYMDFVNKELILFSREDNQRSIPSMVDGLKPGQRKTLFCSLERNLNTEYKVSELSAYVSENTDYNHGEQSLANTIIKMAQDYVGSNNINLLEPIGQFGTRLSGGKDAASARYIFTKISPATRFLFHKDDDVLLTNEDGQREPQLYIPIIPTVLVNGCEGIGTGWSTFIPKYNTKDIINNIKSLLNNKSMAHMVPSYRGFKGTIEPTEGGYLTTGKYVKDVSKSTITITELPIKHRMNYKKFLHGLKTDNGRPFIEKVYDCSSHSSVHFELLLSEENMKIEDKRIVEIFKLKSKISTKNMTLFDSSNLIKRYNCPNEIIEDFVKVRLNCYTRRKSYMVEQMDFKISKLGNKEKFLSQIISGEIKYHNRGKDELIKELSLKQFLRYDESAGEEKSGYEYLLDYGDAYTNSTQILEKVKEELDKLRTERNELQSTSPTALWLRDIESLENELEKLFPTLEAAGKEGPTASNPSSEASGKEGPAASKVCPLGRW